LINRSKRFYLEINRFEIAKWITFSQTGCLLFEAVQHQEDLHLLKILLLYLTQVNCRIRSIFHDFSPFLPLSGRCVALIVECSQIKPGSNGMMTNHTDVVFSDF